MMSTLTIPRWRFPFILPFPRKKLRELYGHIWSRRKKANYFFPRLVHATLRRRLQRHRGEYKETY